MWAPLLTGLMLGMLTVTIYYPGLHGSFLFDDFANLPALGATGPIDSWPTFWRYITSGTADPTGRPLTLLTFLINARDWPAAPYPFKLTNLILHLLNGMLLALLLQRLGREAFKTAEPHRVDLAAVLGAGFWLLHPLFVSTTLYIVQREAMLPATFTLLGLLTWLRGRHTMQRGHCLRGTMWIALGLGGCTMLGVLSKANGILLPALALVVEYAFLRTCLPQGEQMSLSPGERIYRRVMLPMAWLPTTLVATYLLQQGWNGLVHGITSVRPWTLGQRLLTEPRVLLDYLNLLWLPRPFTPGLFNDHIHASTSLWSPATTTPALFVVIGLIASACLLRRRCAALSLAILFYFVGQSIESSTVALELYFEHRSYLPALLMFWPLALWLCNVRMRGNEKPAIREGRFHGQIAASPVAKWLSASKAKLALAAVILLGLGLMTHARTSLWGNSHEQALLWARLNPDSPRAQANAAQEQMRAGEPEQAVNRLLKPLGKNPDQAQLALNLFDAQCMVGHIDAATVSATREALRMTRDPGTLLVSWFERAMDQAAQPPCTQLSYTTLDGLLQATMVNPHLANNLGRQQDIHYLLGRLALLQGDAATALAQFNLALDAQVRVSAALKQAAMLGSHGFPTQGLAHLDHLTNEPEQSYEISLGMPRIHAWVLQRQKYWPKELSRLRGTLQGAVAQQTHTAE